MQDFFGLGYGRAAEGCWALPNGAFSGTLEQPTAAFAAGSPEFKKKIKKTVTFGRKSV